MASSYTSATASSNCLCCNEGCDVRPDPNPTPKCRKCLGCKCRQPCCTCNSVGCCYKSTCWGCYPVGPATCGDSIQLDGCGPRLAIYPGNDDLQEEDSPFCCQDWCWSKARCLFPNINGKWTITALAGVSNKKCPELSHWSPYYSSKQWDCCPCEHERRNRLFRTFNMTIDCCKNGFISGWIARNGCEYRFSAPVEHMQGARFKTTINWEEDAVAVTVKKPKWCCTQFVDPGCDAGHNVGPGSAYHFCNPRCNSCFPVCCKGIKREPADDVEGADSQGEPKQDEDAVEGGRRRRSGCGCGGSSGSSSSNPRYGSGYQPNTSTGQSFTTPSASQAIGTAASMSAPSNGLIQPSLSIVNRSGCFPNCTANNFSSTVGLTDNSATDGEVQCNCYCPDACDHYAVEDDCCYTDYNCSPYIPVPTTKNSDCRQATYCDDVNAADHCCCSLCRPGCCTLELEFKMCGNGYVQWYVGSLHESGNFRVCACPKLETDTNGNVVVPVDGKLKCRTVNRRRHSSSKVTVAPACVDCCACDCDCCTSDGKCCSCNNCCNCRETAWGCNSGCGYGVGPGCHGGCGCGCRGCHRRGNCNC